MISPEFSSEFILFLLYFFFVNAGFIMLCSFYLLFVVASFSHFFFLDKIM